MSADSDEPAVDKSPGGTVFKRYATWQTKSQPGFTDAPGEWAELRHAYYEKWFGESSIVWHEMMPVIPHIDVLVFPPSKAHGRDYYTLATSGMSDERMTLDENVPPDRARAELLMYLPMVDGERYSTEPRWYFNALRFLAHFAYDHHTWIGHGHTLQNGAPPGPFAPGSILTNALFMIPIFESPEFQNGLTLGDDPVNFLWVSLLSDDEVAFKLEHGFGALLDRFQAVKYPQVLDVGRKSILTPPKRRWGLFK